MVSLLNITNIFSFLFKQSLGGMMCAFIPFVTTMAILANSMTLVGIALDRYFAVIRIVKGPWEPGRTFCVAATILLWGLAAGISSPMLSSYTIFDIYVIITNHPISSEVLGLEQFEMCAGEKVLELKKKNYNFF